MKVSIFIIELLLLTLKYMYGKLDISETTCVQIFATGFSPAVGLKLMQNREGINKRCCSVVRYIITHIIFLNA